MYANTNKDFDYGINTTSCTYVFLDEELSVFKSIHDNYPKYLLTMDEVFVPDHAGVRTMNVIDCLLGHTEF